MENDYKGQWCTVPTESDNEDNSIIFVTGRKDIEKFRNNPRFNIRVEVTMPYQAEPSGMPKENEAHILGDVTDRLVDIFQRDPIAVLTGIYTGCGTRNWIFYTLSTHIFQRKINEALSDLPTLPISIIAENDPDWLEYDEMNSVLD